MPNPHFLDASIAAREFVVPCLEGLGCKAGPLVFQVSPLPRSLVEEAATADRALGGVLRGAAPELGKHRPLYALELRNAELLDAALMRMLASGGVRYCVGLHDRMPEVERQEAALQALDGDAPGDLVVRWNLHRGFLYQAAKQRYEPFDKLVDEDPRPAAIAGPHGRRARSRPAQGVDHRQQQGRGRAPAVVAEARRGDRTGSCSERGERNGQCPSAGVVAWILDWREKPVGNRHAEAIPVDLVD